MSEELSSPLLSSLHSTPRSVPLGNAEDVTTVRMFANPAARNWPQDRIPTSQRSGDGVVLMNDNAAAVDEDEASMPTTSGAISAESAESLVDTVSFAVPDAQASGVASSADASLSMARLPNNAPLRQQAAAGTSAAEPRIPTKVGFSGDQECTLDFALSGATTPPNSTDGGRHDEGVNASFRRWDALRDVPASTGSKRARPASTDAPSGAEGTEARVAHANLSKQQALQGGQSGGDGLMSEVTQPAPQSDEMSSGNDALDPCSSDAISGFELSGIDSLAVAQPAPSQADAQGSLTAPADMLSSLTSSIRWYDNAVAPDWQNNPLAEESSRDVTSARQPTPEVSDTSAGTAAVRRMLS